MKFHNENWEERGMIDIGERFGGEYCLTFSLVGKQEPRSVEVLLGRNAAEGAVVGTVLALFEDDRVRLIEMLTSAVGRELQDERDNPEPGAQS